MARFFMFPSRRKQYSSGAKWEPVVGYSRAYRVGPFIEVSGTCAVDQDGNPVAIGDPFQQTIRALQIIEEAIRNLGGSMQDVVRTRMYVTDIRHWEEIGKAHGQYFKDIRPVTTMVEVSKLITQDFLVEIEASAILK